MTKLTKRTLDSLKPRSKPYIAYDSDLAGFAVRVMPSGFKSFLFEYRAGSRRAFLKKRTAIGPFGPMTTEQARDAAMKLRIAIRGGADPQTEKNVQHGAITVSALVAAFKAQHVEVHCKGNTVEAHQSALEHLCKAYGSLRAANITRTR